MTGNVFGKCFRIASFGESHGNAVGVVIDGCPAGMEISKAGIQKELDRRKPGQSKITTQRKEEDKVQILSGIFEGRTTGTPIAMIVWNKDAKSSDYEKLKNLFRPGHADYTYWKKYGVRDYRGGGRSSGRETIARVMASALAKKILKKDKIEIYAYTKEVHGIKAEKIDFAEIEKNPIRCPDKEKAVEMQKEIEKAMAENDSVGGIVEIVVKNCPAGLGEPVFSKLDAELSKALMGIGAVKGVEFGAGFEAAKMKGSEMNDPMDNEKGKIKFLSNNAGGILGGISTGQDLVMRIAVKPTASIAREQKTIDVKGNNSKIKVEGRHDPCICPRIVPVAEAMTAIVIADFILRQEKLNKNNKN